MGENEWRALIRDLSFRSLRASWYFFSTGRSRLRSVSTFGIHFSLFLSRFTLDGDTVGENSSDDFSPQTRSSQKIDSLSFVTDYESHFNRVKELNDETEQKLARLEKICGELGKKKLGWEKGMNSL